jgi:hypothetical protein
MEIGRPVPRRGLVPLLAQRGHSGDMRTPEQLMPEILAALRQGPRNRTPLLIALGCRLQPGNFTRAVTCLVDDRRIQRIGRGAYSIGPKGFEPFTEDDALRLAEEYSARSKRLKVVWRRREGDGWSKPLRSSRPDRRPAEERAVPRRPAPP